MTEIITWQWSWNWRNWHWYWHDKVPEYDRNVDHFRHWAGFGPFQITWYSW